MAQVLGFQLLPVLTLALALQGWINESAVALTYDSPNPSPSACSRDKETLVIEPGNSFPGQFRGFTPDGRLVTYEFSDRQTRLFSLDGTEQMAFTNTSLWFAPAGEIIALMSPVDLGTGTEYTTRLITPDGIEIAQFPGASPTFVLNEPRLVIADQAEDISRLVSFAGEPIAVLRGRYFGESLTPQDLVTYSEIEGRFYLYDLDGLEIAAFPGSIEGWRSLPGGEQVLVSDREHTRLFSADGVELATYSGYGAGSLPDGQGIFTYFQGENLSRLLSLNGEEIAVYAGSFSALTPDRQRVVTRLVGRQETRIYSLDGAEIAVLPGLFRTFTPDATGIIATLDDEQMTVLYSLDGVERATYAGGFSEFWPEPDIIVTSRFQYVDGSAYPIIYTHLYRPDGEELASLLGSFGGISPDGVTIAVSPNGISRTDLYQIAPALHPER